MASIGEVYSNVENLRQKGVDKAKIQKYIGMTGYSGKQIGEYHKSQGVEENRQPADPRTWGEFFMGEKRDEGDQDLVSIKQAMGEKAPEASTYSDPITDIAQSTGLVEDNRADLSAGMSSTVSDAAYGDVWQKQLEKAGRFVSRDKDSKGREVVTFKGDDGKDVRAYVNPPEWDASDFQRFMGNVAPSLIAGGIASSIAKGVGYIGSAVFQGVTQGLTEVGRDAVAIKQGSKQGVDGSRALMAAGGGAVGDVAGNLIGKWWSGAQGAKILQKIKEGKPLKPHEMKRAVENGLNPDDLKGASPGQQMNDPETLAQEYATRQGKHGPDAQTDIIDEDMAASQGVLDDAGVQLDKKGVPESRIQTDLNEARVSQGAVEDAAWTKAREAGHMTPETEVQKELVDRTTATGRVTEEVSETVLTKDALKSFDEAFDPALGGRVMKGAAKDAYDFVQAYKKSGRIPDNPAYRVHRPTKGARDDLDAMRKTLYGMAKSGGDDSSDAFAIYGAFNDWVEDMAEKGLIKMEGGASNVDASHLYASAVNTTRVGREMFNRGSGSKKLGKGALDTRAGSKDAARRVLQKIYDADGMSNGALSQEMFGAPGSVIKEGRHEVVDHMKQIAAQHDKVRIIPEMRRAYLINMIVGKDGKQVPTEQLIKNIELQLENQSRMVDSLGLTKQLQDILKKSKILARGKKPVKYEPKKKGLAGKAMDMAAIISPYRLMVRMIYTQRVAKDILPKANHAAKLRPEAGNKGKAISAATGVKATNSLMEDKPKRYHK